MEEKITVPFIYNDVSSEILDSIFNIITEFVSMDEWAKRLRLSALGGRMCWNADPLPTLLQEKKLMSAEYYQFLRGLSRKGHTSVFEHTTVCVDLKNCINKEKFNFYVNDITKLIPGMDFITTYVSANEMGFPSYREVDEHVEQCIESYSKLILFILNHYCIGSACNNEDGKIRLNFRSYLELCKAIGKEDWLWENISKCDAELINVLAEYDLTSGAKLYILNIENDNPKSVSFVIDGCSLVLTHQLVRHRYQTSFSQRSGRYTNFDGDRDLFVIPRLDYLYSDLNDSDIIQIKESMMVNYMYCKELYNSYKNGNLFNGIKLKKEDARFILPTGLRTKIMVTLNDIGLKNFIYLRNKSEAQWEIAEIATILSTLIK